MAGTPWGTIPEPLATILTTQLGSTGQLLAATLIFVESDAPFFLQGRPAMKFRMDKTLRFWVDCSYEDRRYENTKRTRTQLITEILREYEQCGDAMRYLDAAGQIAWKASPSMLQKLADAEREVEDDMEDRP